MSVYYSLFHSHLSYGFCVWGHADDIYTNKIEISQKRAVRIICNADYLSPTDEIFKKLKILRLDQLFSHQYACLMWDFKHNNLPTCFDNYFTNVSEVHDHFTRSAASEKMIETCFNTVHGKCEFKYFGAKNFNSINELVFFNQNITKSSFKHKYKEYLLEQN